MLDQPISSTEICQAQSQQGEALAQQLQFIKLIGGGQGKGGSRHCCTWDPREIESQAEHMTTLKREVLHASLCVSWVLALYSMKESLDLWEGATHLIDGGKGCAQQAA